MKVKAKARKPRATKKRVDAAEMYLNILTIRSAIGGEEGSEIYKMLQSNRKTMAIGKEYIEDLLLWEKDRIISKTKSND